MPTSGLRKVSRRSVDVLVTSRAAWISSFRSTSTPSPRASGAPATRTALTRLSAASELRPVAGRCDPTRTTVASTLRVRLRKYAVSSSVAVPWVTTRPSSGASRATASCTTPSSASQSTGATAALDSARKRTGTISAASATSGNRSRSSSGSASRPASMYSQRSRLPRPIEEIVPPVPTRATRRFPWAVVTTLLGAHGDPLPPLLAIRLIGLDGRDHLAGHEVDAPHRDVVGHQPLAAPEHHVGGIDDVHDALELPDHRVGAPGDDLVRRVGFLVALAGASRRHVGRAGPRLLAPALPGLTAHIARRLKPVAWRDAERRPQLPEEMPALLVGFLVGVGDAHSDDVAAMPGCRRETDPRGDVVVEVVDLVDDVERRGERHVRVAVLRGPADRFGTDDAGNPDRRVRTLQRTDPRIDHPVVVVPAFPAKGTGRRPRLDDHVVGLVEPLPVVDRVRVSRDALLAEAANEAADHPPAGEDVDHRDLLGYPERVVVDREHVAEKDDPPLSRRPRQDRADDVDRGHHAERVVVVLVDHDAVESGLGRVQELVEVHRVELARALGAEMLVGKHQVVVTAPACFVLRIRRESHLGEEVDFLDHNEPPLRPHVSRAAPGSLAPRARTPRASPSRACDRNGPEPWRSPLEST